MSKFFEGSFRQFAAVIENIECDGSWKDLGTSMQYRSSDGAIINWSPTGVVTVTGRKPATAKIGNMLYDHLSEVSMGTRHGKRISKNAKQYRADAHKLKTAPEIMCFLFDRLRNTGEQFAISPDLNSLLEEHKDAISRGKSIKNHLNWEFLLFETNWHGPLKGGETLCSLELLYLVARTSNKVLTGAIEQPDAVRFIHSLMYQFSAYEPATMANYKEKNGSTYICSNRHCHSMGGVRFNLRIKGAVPSEEEMYH